MLAEKRAACGVGAGPLAAARSPAAPASNPGPAFSIAAAIASIASAMPSRSRWALASASARSVETSCSSNSASSARSVLARSSTVRSSLSARASLASAAPATASRSAVLRLSATTASAARDLPTSFSRAVCFSRNAFSKRSTGLSSRLKNDISPLAKSVFSCRISRPLQFAKVYRKLGSDCGPPPHKACGSGRFRTRQRQIPRPNSRVREQYFVRRPRDETQGGPRRNHFGLARKTSGNGRPVAWQPK